MTIMMGDNIWDNGCNDYKKLVNSNKIAHIKRIGVLEGIF